MNSRPRLIIVTVMAAALTMLPGTALSMSRGGFGQLPGLHEILKTANLTADQKNQVQQIMQASRSQRKQLVEQLRSLREQIADKVAGTGTLNQSEVSSLQQQMAQVRSQLDGQSLQAAVKVRAVLTTDQLTRVAQTHQQLKGLHQQIRALTVAPDTGASVTPEKAQELMFQ